ncbi:hypothetical protein [Nakamurella sp. PAMC28650]|uniref:hypothetical protein n=1 Tax=Nakamurella sp. PAMC28650 TaxID=2762325 RepID=UPI00164CE769|nr:hypothetical protein [Nakamurella sp. PAMC28650]QNK80067.1 hypothetical protein H7F38_17820 [Nakamurella sp. PAMC28650]
MTGFVSASVPPWPAVNDLSGDHYEHWALTHFVLDGHHKLEPAASTGEDLQLLALVCQCPFSNARTCAALSRAGSHGDPFRSGHDQRLASSDAELSRGEAESEAHLAQAMADPRRRSV